MFSGFYYISCDGILYECRARGGFRKEGISPLVGDRVEFSATDSSHGVVEKIMARSSCLERPAVTNIEKLFIVSSYATPQPDALLIDRLSALAVFHGIEPIIVFNKCDKGVFEFADVGRSATFENVVYISAVSGQGVELLVRKIEDLIMVAKRPVTFTIPNSEAGALNILYKNATVQNVEYGAEYIIATALADAKTVGMLRKYTDIPEEKEEY